MDEVYRAIGHFTVNWASVEMALDSANAIFYHRCGGQRRINHEIPKALRQKLQFFRNSLNKIPVLAPYNQAGLKLAERIGALKRDRHDSIHGFIIGWNPETKSLSRSIVEYHKAQYKYRDHEVTVPQIETWARETGQLALEMLDFTQSLVDGIVKPQDTLRGRK